MTLTLTLPSNTPRELADAAMHLCSWLDEALGKSNFSAVCVSSVWRSPTRLNVDMAVAVAAPSCTMRTSWRPSRAPSATSVKAYELVAACASCMRPPPPPASVHLFGRSC